MTQSASTMNIYRHDVYVLINVEQPTEEQQIYIYQLVASFYFPDEEIILSRYMYTYAAYYRSTQKQQRKTPEQIKESKRGREKNRELRYRERRREELNRQQE